MLNKVKEDWTKIFPFSSVTVCQLQLFKPKSPTVAVFLFATRLETRNVSLVREYSGTPIAQVPRDWYNVFVTSRGGSS